MKDRRMKTDVLDSTLHPSQRCHKSIIHHTQLGKRLTLGSGPEMGMLWFEQMKSDLANHQV